MSSSCGSSGKVERERRLASLPPPESEAELEEFVKFKKLIALKSDDKGAKEALEYGDLSKLKNSSIKHTLEETWKAYKKERATRELDAINIRDRAIAHEEYLEKRRHDSKIISDVSSTARMLAHSNEQK